MLIHFSILIQYSYDDTISLYRNEAPFGGPPNIITQPTNVAAGIGGTAIFGATVMGQAPLAYAWKRNGTNLAASSRITGTSNSTLTILVSTFTKI